MNDDLGWQEWLGVALAIPLAFIGVLAYNECFGTPEEQERSRVDKIRSICADVLDAGTTHD